MSERRQIHFEKLDLKRISLLCENEESVRGLRDLLLKNGFKVEFATSAQSFYAMLESGLPGYALISMDLNELACRTIADFTQRRFMIPILFFREKMKSENSFLPPKIVPEMRSADSHEPPVILRAVIDFQAQYEAEIKKAGESVSAPPPLSHALFELFKNKFTADVSTPTHQQYSLFTAKIEDSDHNRFFFFAIPNQNQALLEKTILSLENQLQEFSKEKILLHKSLVDAPELLIQKLREKAKNVYHCQVESLAILIAFTDEQSDTAGEQLNMAGGLFLVPIESWWTEASMSFGAYLWFHKNQRKILYLRAGQSLPAESFERFEKQGCSYLALEPSELDIWRGTREFFQFALTA